MIQFVIPREVGGKEARRIEGKVLQDHTLVPDARGFDTEKYPQGYFRLAFWERGGGKTNTGSSQIVVGSAGDSLEPAFVRRGGHLACQKHALFTGIGPLTTVKGERSRGEITVLIERHTLIRGNGPGNGPQDEVRILWEGTGSVREDLSLLDEWLEELPTSGEQFHAAIRAAAEKAFCYHCRKPHFAVVADRDLCSR